MYILFESMCIYKFKFMIHLRQYDVYANYAESVMLKNVKYVILINIYINMCEAII